MKKYFLIKLVVVCIFIMTAYMICDLTKYYINPVSYEENEIRVIIDDEEVTKSLPDEPFLANNKVMLSLDTIKKYFDEYIYFDEKYKTIIVSDDVNLIKLELDSNQAILNGEKIGIENPTTMLSGDIYVPIDELKEFYDINIEYNEKIIITTSEKKYQKIKISQNRNVKLYKKEMSLTIGKAMTNDVLTIFDSNSEYAKVRLQNGDLGYIRKDKIKGETISENELKIVQEIPKKKISLSWEYAENYTPNRNGETKRKGLDVISPTWFYMKNESGDLKNTIDLEYIKWAKSQGYVLWPTLKNDTMGLEKTSLLVTDMHAREKLINSVVELALRYDLDGINLDFECMYKKDKDAFSQFVREFSVALRRNGLIASVDVTVPDGSETWSLCYDRTAISNTCDYLILMAYDQYGTKQDGPVASLKWVDESINKMLNQEKVPNEKLILGVPFYSKYIKNKIDENGEEKITGQAVLYMSGLEKYYNSTKYKESIKWDEEMGQYYMQYKSGNVLEKLWFEDRFALEEKVNLMSKYDLAGVASWRLGYETEIAWEIINKYVK